ncbi:MAG: hypothetical protein EOO11_16200 [Chitinophagaceae bacterium]|nr:MAG: hypothetical protein EOO11_16200 [Chitinophagaceae bacterium]
MPVAPPARLLLLLLMMFSLSDATAQTARATVWPGGGAMFTIHVGPAYLYLTRDGTIRTIGASSPGYVRYEKGLLIQAGQVYFSYSTGGRLQRIGDLYLSYDSYGRLNAVGNRSINYYENRVAYLLDQEVRYNINGSLRSFGDAYVSYNYEGTVVQEISDRAGLITLQYDF